MIKRMKYCKYGLNKKGIDKLYHLYSDIINTNLEYSKLINTSEKIVLILIINK